jgi:hypothetical protein
MLKYVTSLSIAITEQQEVSKPESVFPWNRNYISGWGYPADYTSHKYGCYVTLSQLLRLPTLPGSVRYFYIRRCTPDKDFCDEYCGFWNVTPYNLIEIYQHFGGSSWPYLRIIAETSPNLAKFCDHITSQCCHHLEGRFKQYVSPKRRYTSRLHGITMKTVVIEMWT